MSIPEKKQMNYDNKHTDKKLQELENQSLPDLSKMDDHWQQMSLMLQAAAGSAEAGKRISRGKIILVIVSAAVILVVLFFFLRPNNNGERSSESAQETSVIKTPVTRDTTQQIGSTQTDSLRKTGADSIANVPGGLSVMTSEAGVNKKILLERYYEDIEKKPGAFIINNRRDTVIYGKEGTRLAIPANAFASDGEVILLISEFYSIDDMVSHKLTTTCNGRQLVTSGMIYLDARDKNDQLVDLKKGTVLRLDMPNPRNQKEMELFYGYEYYRNNITTVIDSINWSRTNQPFANANKSLRSYDTVKIKDYKNPDYPYDYYLGDSIGLARKQGETDSISLQRFGVNINRLGWINCDRFYNDPRPRVDLIVDLGDNPDNYSTLLVFENLASIMPPSSRQGNSIRFSNLPQGEPARIVSFGIKNNKPARATKSLVISTAIITDLSFKEISNSIYSKNPSK